MKKIAVLGSTGSIGKQTLEVAAANPDKLQIKVLAAHVNDKLLEEQIEKFAPDMAVLTDEKAAQRLKERYTGKTKILAGREGLLEAVTYDGIDTVLASMVGYAGLLPTLEAIKHGKDIALANKETLVAGGQLVMEAAKKNGACIPRTKLCGGGAKSKLWRKIVANVMNIPVDIPQTEQGPGFGAAMLAMVGCGEYASVQDAANAIVRVKETVLPDAKTTADYESRYRHFTKLYPALKGLF